MSGSEAFARTAERAPVRGEAKMLAEVTEAMEQAEASARADAEKRVLALGICDDITGQAAAWRMATRARSTLI